VTDNKPALDQRTLDLPLIVIGGGGHAKVIISTLSLRHRRVLGFVDVKRSLPPLLDVTHLGDDDAVFLHSPDEVRLVNGIGGIDSTGSRRMLYEKFRDKQYVFETVIHPSAVIALEVHIEDGVEVMAGAIIQPGVMIGSNVIINTGARVDHDCSIDAHAHIAPGVTLSGSVHIGQGAHVGTGACIIQGIKVGDSSVVGAGAVVISDVPAGDIVVGVPARSIARPVAAR
jgi:sugar O-acyltransferase (sialic acid O-acetyltransferase NeuD family)